MLVRKQITWTGHNFIYCKLLTAIKKLNKNVTLLTFPPGPRLPLCSHKNTYFKYKNKNKKKTNIKQDNFDKRYTCADV